VHQVTAPWKKVSGTFSELMRNMSTSGLGMEKVPDTFFQQKGDAATDNPAVSPR
jgi:hypothetical protein